MYGNKPQGICWYRDKSSRCRQPLGITTFISCSDHKDDEDKKVSPPEDLMQEHGLLNRVLFIYDTCRLHLFNNEPFPITAIANSAGIIRTFVEDYHEKQEENYLFPRFQKANQLTDLVNILHSERWYPAMNMTHLAKNLKIMSTNCLEMTALRRW